MLLWFVPSCQTLFITMNACSTDCLFLVNTSKFFLAKPYGLNKQTGVIKPPKRPNETPPGPKLILFFLTVEMKNEDIWVFPVEVLLTSQKWLCCHLPGSRFEVRSALCTSWSEVNPFSPSYPHSKRERKGQLKQKWKDVEIKRSSVRLRKVKPVGKKTKQNKTRRETRDKEEN